MKLSQKLWAGPKRPPDVIIGPEDDPYLYRWHVIPRNPLFNIYLHRFYRSDDDRALHDHPWYNLSVLLQGSYIEHRPEGNRVLRAGNIAGRRPTSRHRIELIDGHGVWTLFVTGPRLRMWGFHCPEGFVPFPQFEAQNGCEGMNNAMPIPKRGGHKAVEKFGKDTVKYGGQ